MKNQVWASRWALAFVTVVVGGSFVWWYRNRPSYLLMRAHEQIGKEGQAEMIATYEQLLQKGGLSAPDEIRLRTSLAQYYLRAFRSADTSSIGYSTDYNFWELQGYKPHPKQSENFRTGDAADHPFLVKGRAQAERVIALDPNNAFAHYLMGLVLVEKRSYRFAAEEYELSRKLDPRDPRPVDGLARIRMWNDDFEGARELALQAIAIDPTYDEARATLVRALCGLGQFENALEQNEKMSPGFRSIPSMRARYAELLARQNYWEAAAAELERAAKEAPGDGLVTLMTGAVLLKQERYDEAAGAFAQSAELLKRFLDPLLFQARTAALRRNLPEAARLSQRISEYVSPRAPELHVVNALAHLCRGDADKAAAAADEALRLDRYNQDAMFIRASIFRDRRQFDELGAALRPMLDNPEHRSEAYARLAESLLYQGKLDLAQDAAETAIKWNSRNANGFGILGLVRAHLKDHTGADRAFQDALRLNPYSTSIAAQVAAGKALAGRSNEAEAELRELVGRRPHSADAWQALGDIRLRAKRYAEAAQAYQGALDLTPYLLRAQVGMIECLFATGQSSAADVMLSEALKNNSEDRDVLAWRSRLRRA